MKRERRTGVERSNASTRSSPPFTLPLPPSLQTQKKEEKKRKTATHSPPKHHPSTKCPQLKLQILLDLVDASSNSGLKQDEQPKVR